MSMRVIGSGKTWRALRGLWSGLFVALLAFLWSGAAPAQTAKPSASASAKAAPSASASVAASAAAAPSGSATAKAAPSASASAAPSASPSAGASAGALPPGHPPTGGDGDGDNAHGGGQPNPHAGGDPHGGSNARGQLFEAPPDTAEDDPSLPPGTIVLSLKDAEERPLPMTDVTLGILHNTVAAGESREKKSGTTDAQGTITWSDLALGSGTSYRASVARGPALFGTDPFALGDRAGKRVVLHVYMATNDIEKALVGAQGLVYVSLREDAIVFEQLYGIWNLGSIAWVPENQTIELPEDYKAFNRPDSMAGVGIDEVNGKGLLRGTIGPGRHDIQFRFQVPLEGDESQTIKLTLPPHVAQMRVMVESSKNMNVSVPGFPAARKAKNRDGKRVLVTERAVAREEGGLKTLDITLTGLPTAGPVRWVASVGALLAVAAAVIYLIMRSDKRGPDEETRRDLVDAREALLREIVELTRAHKAGEIGPKTYERVHNALLDALDRLQSKIAESEDWQQRAAVPMPSPGAARGRRVADADEDE